ncbi:MAG: hypothetical protein K9N49_01180, partial [Candidatus Marinimicrobia bacterium]|nr:hypothetical protein [Candidatus Neomarinimicrobiota bacterium]
MKHNQLKLAAGVVSAALLLGLPAVGWAQAVNWDEIIFRTVAETSFVIHEYRAVGEHDFATPAGVTAVEYLVVGGGGAGGTSKPGYGGGGGGGAGGLLKYVAGEADNSGTDPLAVSGTLDVTVGAGAPTAGDAAGANGSNSLFGEITATGGGGGGRGNILSFLIPGKDGGSGGGSPGYTPDDANKLQPGGEGVVGQGHDGGVGEYKAAAGGGGAAAAGVQGTGGTTMVGGAGGAGVASAITSAEVYYAGGGGGGGQAGGGLGGVGGGGNAGPSANTHGSPGAANTGGGGGGNSVSGVTYTRGGAGGSGIVVVRYALADVTDYQNGYKLSGNARRIQADNDVDLKIAQNETLSLLADGEVQLGADATLAVQGTLLLGAAADVTLGSGVLTI